MSPPHTPPPSHRHTHTISTCHLPFCCTKGQEKGRDKIREREGILRGMRYRRGWVRRRERGKANKVVLIRKSYRQNWKQRIYHSFVNTVNEPGQLSTIGINPCWPLALPFSNVHLLGTFFLTALLYLARYFSNCSLVYRSGIWALEELVIYLSCKQNLCNVI